MASNKNIIITGTNSYGNMVFVIKPECQDENIPATVSVSPVCTNILDFDCDACLPTPVPVIPEVEPRKVRPGYFIKNPCLTTDYVEKVNCNFGNQVYDQMISVRYGINSCCEVDVNKWAIKKHIVDFALMTIPKEEEYTPRVCYCYNISAKAGAGVFKYLSCDGTWTTVSLNSLDQVRVCSQNTPQFVSGTYTPEGITNLGTVCTTNDDCNIN